MTDIKLDILPHRSAVMADHGTELHVLVRAQAPSRPSGIEADRAPLNLALVLDRSGSMSGKPLEQAKRCATYIIEQLDGRDTASVIVYDSEVDVLIPSTAVADKAMFRDAIDGVRSGGSTALFDGWHEGARQVLAAERGDSLGRVLLLSDGCANQGLTAVGAITRHVTEMLESGVSTSTYGLGHRFNEELMVEMARAGGGQSYYGESAEDLLDPFQEEFSLMSALCARDLRLMLSAPAGVQFELLNDYRCIGRTDTWQLPDLAYGGEAWALVKLTVPADLPDTKNGQDQEILTAALSFRDIESNSSDTRSYTLRLPRVSAVAWAAIPADQRVTARMQEVRVAALQREVRECALRRDWNAVDRLIAQAESEAGDNAWVKASLGALKRYARQRDRDRMSKEAFYSARKMTNRLAERDEDARRYHASEEADKAAFLRKKMEQGKRLDDRP